MVRTNQGGSILSFIIVGSVLAVLLVGGAYFVRRQLAPNSDTETTVTDNSSRNGEAPSDNDDTSKDDGTGWNTDGDQTDGSAEKPAEGDDSETDGNTDTPVATDLPETGPADVLIGSIMIGSIVGTGAAYQRSRRLGSL